MRSIPWIGVRHFDVPTLIQSVCGGILCDSLTLQVSELLTLHQSRTVINSKFRREPVGGQEDLVSARAWMGGEAETEPAPRHARVRLGAAGFWRVQELSTSSTRRTTTGRGESGGASFRRPPRRAGQGCARTCAVQLEILIPPSFDARAMNDGRSSTSCPQNPA